MKKIPLVIALCCSPAIATAAQTPVTNIGAFADPAKASINTLKAATNTKLEVIEANRQDHVANIATKADKDKAVRIWLDHPDGTTIVAGTPVWYNGKLYNTTQNFLKTAGATPDTFTEYFEPIAGATYTLPVATANTLGGVKVGERLTMTDGVLSADVQSGTGAVDSVNGKTGTVVLTPDDMVDTSTINKFVTDAEKTTWNAKQGELMAGTDYLTPSGSAALLTNFPTLNQNTTGTAAGLTAQYINWESASGGSSIGNKPTLGTSSALNVGTSANNVVQLDSSGALPAVSGANLTNLPSASLPSWLPSVGPTNGRQILQAVGGCSLETYDTQATCEANAGTWTTPVYANTSIFSGLINDAGAAADDLWSAAKIISMLAAKDNKHPSTLSLTEDITITSSQLLDNKYLSNHGSTGTVKIILPAVEYQITRTAIVEAAYTVKICPPSGESLNVNGTDLTVDYCTISPVIVGSKTTVTRRKNGVGWIWDVDGVRGTWTTGL